MSNSPRRVNKAGSDDLIPSAKAGTSREIGAYPLQSIAITNSHGQLTVAVFAAESKDSGATYLPVGNALQTVVLDAEALNAASDDECFAQFVPALPLIDDQPYAIIADWSNDSDIYFFKPTLSTVTTSDFIWRDKRTETAGWETTPDAAIAMYPYILGYGLATYAGAVSTVPTGKYYAQLELMARSVTLATGETRAAVDEGLNFKLAQHGITDDAAGTYTGIASSVIANPAIISQFVLQDPVIGLGLSSTFVDTGTFAGASTHYDSNWSMGFALENSLTCKDAAVAIARQSRSVLWKERNGKMAFEYPMPFSTPAVTLDESTIGDDLQIVAATDADESDIVNNFSILYGVDNLNQPKDEAFLRRAETTKYSGHVWLGNTDSSDGDAFRVAECEASQLLYGRRDNREAFDTATQQTAAIKLRNYLCDRFSQRQDRITVRVPRAAYYASIDLFTKIRINHRGLSVLGGEVDASQPAYGDALGQVYVDGVPGYVWSGGTIDGFVTAIEEGGASMTLTIETMSSFEG